MSAGEFETGKYASNSGRIYKCKAQPETKALTMGAEANTYPVADVDQEVSAKLTGGKQSIGVVARTVTLKWNGAAPDGYDENSLLVLPIFREELYNAIVPDVTVGLYLGASVMAVGRSPERVN